MKYGIGFFPTDKGMSAVEIAREVEQRGFEVLLFAEHTHIPSAQKTVPRSRQMSDRLRRTLDPFVALSAAAAATTRLRIGTGVCLVVERDPILLAKEVASLDLISGGRMIFGIGAGWNVEEMANHGTDARTRRRLLRERIEAMKAIWSQDEAQYHGRFVNFEPIWQWPKPLQKPHPPIWIGGNGQRAMEAVVQYCDGWAPLDTIQDLPGHITELKRMAAAAGRDFDGITMSPFFAPLDRQTVERYAGYEIDQMLYMLPREDRESVLPMLDLYAKLRV